MCRDFLWSLEVLKTRQGITNVIFNTFYVGGFKVKIIAKG